MKLKRIINSLLENDMYKFSMGQAILHQFAGYKTTWAFKCRDKGVFFTKEMVDEIREQIHAYCQLEFTSEELQYLDDSTVWIKGAYIDYLKKWKPDFNDFTIGYDEGCGLSIEPAGSWLNTSMYEVPVLAIVNEVYFAFAHDTEALHADFMKRLDSKLKALQNGVYDIGTFSEFGLRRRLSGVAQYEVVNRLAEAQKAGVFHDSNFVGTSNVYLAKELGINKVGTMAHEWAMCVGQGNPMHNVAYSNWYMLNAWVREYGVLNGIALTDTLTTKLFNLDFNLTFAKLFSGVRHDSGDPYDWGEIMIRHYEELGLNPKEKTLLFSDSLNFEKADALYRYFRDRATVAFGIGTYLSNDTSVKPLNIVMKVTSCNGTDVAKLSDTEGKGMCKSDEYVNYLKRSINWRFNH